MPSIAIVWFRRDLRLHDHPALTAAVEAADVVIPLFVFDEPLLEGTTGRPRTGPGSCARASSSCPRRSPSAGCCAPGRARPARGRASRPSPASSARARCTSPATRRRTAGDATGPSRSASAADGVAAASKRGLYVHEPDEVAEPDGGPFTRLRPVPPRLGGAGPAPGAAGAGPHAVTAGDALVAARPRSRGPAPPTADRALLPAPGEAAARDAAGRAGSTAAIDGYATDPQPPRSRTATSRLSQDLRWGLLSPLEVVERAEGSGTRAAACSSAELAWREFYAHVLWHHPRDPAGAVPRASRPSPGVTTIRRRSMPGPTGRTGYPVVDAAMRQLRASGFVHNRARMIAASFLTKDLLLDWRLGEAEFMRHLVDGDVASNNGGWQWTAWHRNGCAAVLPDLQPGAPGPPIRPGRACTCGAGCRSSRASRRPGSTSRGR